MNKEILLWAEEKNVKKVSEELKSGEVIVGTSDTVLGFLAVVSEHGMVALNQIKGRTDKPYIVLIGDKRRIFDFTGLLAAPVKALVDNCWPGPLTLIVKAKEGLPKYLQAENMSIAVRVPKHTGLLELLRTIPALFSTSANKAGKPVPSCLQDIDPSMVHEVSSIIADDSFGAGCPVVIPSTIIDCTGEQLKVVREGSYAIDILESIAGQKFSRS